jgi:hypothetical protein
LVSDAEENPHLSLGRAKGELYIARAEHDELAPLPLVAELRPCSGHPARISRLCAGPADCLVPGIMGQMRLEMRRCFQARARSSTR